MRIGIIGAGQVGTGIAKRLGPKGHELMLGFGRDPNKIVEAARAFDARAGSPADVVAFADVVVLAVPWAVIGSALSEAGQMAGKIVWDFTNTLKPDMSGLAIGTTTSGAEEIARQAPGARVVKGIPPFAELLHAEDPTVGGWPVELFVAGNDAAAKTLVAGLMSELPAHVTDAGDLAAARLIEPAMMLLVRFVYGLGFGPRLSLDVRTATAHI